MFNRKNKQIRKEWERSQAILRDFVDSLRDGDLIEVTYNGGEDGVVYFSEPDGETTKITISGKPSVGVVTREGTEHVSYGGSYWSSGLKFEDDYQTTAITGMRILRRAGEFEPMTPPEKWTDVSETVMAAYRDGINEELEQF